MSNASFLSTVPPLRVYQFRRFLARTTDILVYMCALALVCGSFGYRDVFHMIRVRYPIMMPMVVLFTWTFVEALLMWRIGSTPGKSLCGVRVDALDGGQVNLGSALNRSLSVFAFGLSGGITGANLVALLQGYRDLTDLGTTGWDRRAPSTPAGARRKYNVETDAINWPRKLLIGAVIIVLTVTAIFA